MLNPNQTPAKNILLVEDNVEIKEALTEVFEEEGFAVVHAANGQEALEQISRIGEMAISLIVLDLMLPVMTGRELLEILKADLSHPRAQIPIVLTSAAGSLVDQTASWVSGYVKKPIDLNKLLALVDQFAR